MFTIIVILASFFLALILYGVFRTVQFRMTEERQAALVKASGNRHFYTKIAGVTHRNAQNIIRRCSVGERLRLVREPDNPVDNNAVKVCRLSGEQLGYLKASLVEDLARDLDDGEIFTVEISDITGGTADKPTRGVNLLVIRPSDRVTTGEPKPVHK